MTLDVATTIREIVRRDPRYAEPAYEFVFEALAHALRRQGREGHISVRDLLDGMREYASLQYGYLARTVLAHWGVTHCLDFGRIVFNLIDVGLMRKTEEDSIEDFSGGFDFQSALETRFKPDLSAWRDPSTTPDTSNQDID